MLTGDKERKAVERGYLQAIQLAVAITPGEAHPIADWENRSPAYEDKAVESIVKRRIALARRAYQVALKLLHEFPIDGRGD